MKFKPKRDITIDQAIDEYLMVKNATSTLSDSSIYNRRYELTRFSAFCGKHKIDTPDKIHKNIVIAYLHQLKISKSSKLAVIYVLIGFMDFLVDEELALDNYASVIEKPKVYTPAFDFLTFPELENIFQSEAQNAPPKSVDRNLLLLALFTDICLRVSEVINLKLEDVRLDDREIWITRKREKVVKLPLNEDMVAKFLNWYAVRPKYKGSDLPWVFLSSHGQQLKRRQVHYVVSHALKRAGIVKRKQGPHLLRHSGASLKARAGENLVMIQYLLGHENLNTTRRYLHFQWDDLKDMVERSPSFSEPENSDSMS